MEHCGKMRSAAQLVQNGISSQARLESGLMRGIMNQTARSRSHPVLNATAITMVVPCMEHLRIRDSLSAIFEDIGAPALANDVCDDAQGIADRFLGRT